MSSFNLTQVVSEPTRVTPNSATLIVSSTVQVNICSTVPPLYNADHFGIHFSVKTKMPKQKLVSRTIFGDTIWLILTKRQNFWSLLNGTQSFLKSTMTLRPFGLLGRITSCKKMQICIPRARVKTKTNVPWMNQTIRKAIKKRDSLFCVVKRTSEA